MKTLILSCGTGQGHNSCAQAIKECYDNENSYCVLEEALNFISPSFAKFICWGHTTVYRHLHSLFTFGYKYFEKHPKMFYEKSCVYKLLTSGTDKLVKYITEGGFDTVICTHVFASLMITEAQKRYNLSVSSCLVSTDYTCNPGTKESVVDLHFSPDKSLSVYYECPNIKESQIISSGIPVRQMFYSNTEPDKAKAEFGIPSAHKHLLMMCGSMGCGPMKHLAKLLSVSLPEDADLTIVCGTNKKIEKKLKEKYKDFSRIHVLGYVKDMSMLMDSADLYLTNPGGISITEAATKKLPMVFIDAVAGCEEYNRIYFIEHRMAKSGTNVWELEDICLDLLKNPEKLQAMRKSFESFEKQNAAKIIFETMTNSKAL